MDFNEVADILQALPKHELKMTSVMEVAVKKRT
jgi:hypothetical protein